MRDLLLFAREALEDARYSVEVIESELRPALVFEDDTYLGFVVVYPDVEALYQYRSVDARRLIAQYTPDLRAAEDKAWNTYVVWLAGGEATSEQQAALTLLEEDLSGTRKIAAAGLRSAADVEAALLTLLPLNAPPSLPAVDIRTEITARATELDPRALEAFFSSASADYVAKALQNIPS